jgi:hypothetical protein
MAITNFQSLSEQLINIAQNHPYIQKVEFGDIYQKENLLADEYPYAFLHILPSTVKEYTTLFNYSLILADQVNQTQGNLDSNLMQVMSDVLATGMNIIQEIQTNNYEIEIATDISIEPFTSGWLSNAVGWIINLSLTIPTSALNCETPIKNVNIK